MIHVATVGTSILGNVFTGVKDVGSYDLHALLPLVPAGAAPRERADAVRQAWSRVADAGLSAEDTRRFHPAVADAALCAEVDSISRVHRQTRGTNPSALLLASDTEEGLAAVFWVAIQLSLTLGISTIRYTSDPGTSWRTPQEPTIYVAVLAGLNARTGANFSSGMRALGRVGARLWQWAAPGGEDIRFHLSGGYKAAIPFLVTLAEGLRSLEKKGHDHPDNATDTFMPTRVRACIVHDSSDPGDPAGLIDVPLRVDPHDELTALMDRVGPATSAATFWPYLGSLVEPDQTQRGSQLTSLGWVIHDLLANT